MDKEIARLVQNLYLSGPFSPLSLVHFLDTYLDMPSIQGISGLSEIGEIGVQELFGAVVWSRTPIWGCRQATGNPVVMVNVWGSHSWPSLQTLEVSQDHFGVEAGRRSGGIDGGGFQMVPMTPKRLGGRATRGVLSHFHFQGEV